jgi:2-dehydro-3-deoxy-D-arabinonate dehydratase
MHLMRYLNRTGGGARLGVVDGGIVRPIGAGTLGALLARPAGAIREVLERPGVDALRAVEITALPPVDGRMEVWAAGVTYFRSKLARMEESALADVYDRVYESERPELFFKSVPWRVVTDGELIAIRRDSPLNVPEPELAVVANAAGEIIGYLVCNDVSSRSIEGENPLYLPQAKIYAGSCALSSGIRPAWEIDPADLAITLDIHRAGEVVWSGRASTSQMHRSPAELVEYLFRAEQFPEGVVVSTGTGIVPEFDFTLAVGDMVAITVADVGTLVNHVVAGKDAFSWLATSASDR